MIGDDYDVTFLDDQAKSYMFGYLESALESKGSISKADWRRAYEAAEADAARRAAR